jgi:hypothetical protein
MRYLFSVAALCLAAYPLLAQSTLQAQLEVNLGPINIDSYDGVSPNSYSGVTSGPNIPACSYTGTQSNYRACVQYVLAQYSAQGVTGVRIYFGMNGESGSTPFLNSSGALDPNWLAKLSLFMQDLRAANLRYVSLSPSWATWGTGNMSIYACISGSQGAYRYDFTCTSANANAVFYPWLAWATTYTPPQQSAANPNPYGQQGGPYDEAGPLAYNYAPQLGDANAPPFSPRPWVWTSAAGSSSPMFKFWDGIFATIANAQLQVREVDIYPEVPMFLSSLYGRLVYDNVQNVSPLDVINQIMMAHSLSPTATLSTAAFQPRNNASCTALSGDSELVVNAYLLLSAMTTGHFGRIPFDSNGDVCGGISPSDDVYGISSLSGTNVTDIHTYPADAVFDNGWGWIGNPNESAPQYYPDGAPVTNSPLGCAGTGCVQDASNDVDPSNVDPSNPGHLTGSSKTAANQIYTAINSFVTKWQHYGQLPGSTAVVIGETDAYNPGGIGRDGIAFPSMTEGTDCTQYGPYGSILTDAYTDPRTGVTHSVNFWCTPDWKWHRPWSTASAGENVAGLTDSTHVTGLNRPGVILRPWSPLSWGTVISPAPLSGSSDRPYNIGACNVIPNAGPWEVPSTATSITVPVTAPANCQWSTGLPVQAHLTDPKPVYPSWFTLTSNVWQSGSANVTATLVPNSTTSSQSFQLMVGGQAITVIQDAAVAPAAPTGLTPGGAATGVSISPTLSWNPVANATSYIVYFQTNNGVAVNGTSYMPGPLISNTTYIWSVAAVNSFGQTVSASTTFTTATVALDFYTVTPCRVADTRAAAGFTGSYGAPSMTAGQTRVFNVPASSCGIPSTAVAYSLNFTVVPSGQLGHLTTWPTGQPMPNVSTLNDSTGTILANAAIVPAGTNGAVSVYVTDNTDVLFDINGYFAPPLSTGLEFYTVTPCRIADTRTVAGFTGLFGPPSLMAGSQRSFPVSLSACGIPVNAASAYSLNFTVVPPGPLGNLTAWPTGVGLPNVSTLNDSSGTVIANAAIVPAGTNGAISTFATNNTDMLFDINGYFGATSTTGLHFYPVTPCRIADTRTAAGFTGMFGPPSMLALQTRTFPVVSSGCGIPSTAVAYSLNFTVVPPGPLGVLIAWPTGQAMPNVSTLNDAGGAILANAAIVAAGSSGSINVFVNQPTDLLFDINGYFAP